MARLQPGEEAVGEVDINVFWSVGNGVNTEERDDTCQTIIVGEFELEYLRINLLRSLRSQCEPDSLLDTDQLESLGIVKGDERDIGPVIQKDICLLTSDGDLLDVEEHVA